MMGEAKERSGAVTDLLSIVLFYLLSIPSGEVRGH